MALQHSRYVYKQQSLMVAVLTCTAGIILLFWVDLPTFVNSWPFSLPLEAGR